MNMRLHIRQGRLEPDLEEKILKAKEALPEMRIENTDLSDKQNFDKKGCRIWKEYRSENIFGSLTGGYFSVLIQRIINGILTWIQPMIELVTGNITDQDGNTIKLSGFVILLYDQEGRFLLRMDNQPGADKEMIKGKEIHPKILPSLQTSIPKYEDVLAGDVSKDKDLAFLLEYFKETGLTFEMLEWIISDSAHDTSRMKGKVAYSTVEISCEDLEVLACRMGALIIRQDEYWNIIDYQPSLFNPHVMIVLQMR